MIFRIALGSCIAFGLAYHGIRKKSLSRGGAAAAVFVGFSAFAASFRMGTILILFYYFSSKLTKFKADYKATIEEGYLDGGQRNYLQVFASSLLATVLAIAYPFICGEDSAVSFRPSSDKTAAYLWSMYIAHYACATGDTWASEVGILSPGQPRLVTSLFTREVPRGTNGGVSLLGTAASAAGGLFIGLIYSLPLWEWGFAKSDPSVAAPSPLPMVLLSVASGVAGCMLDSLLGATLQATYYCSERKCIAKGRGEASASTVRLICGADVLSNEAVNLLSIGLTMLLAAWLSPSIHCWADAEQCAEAARVYSVLRSFASA